MSSAQRALAGAVAACALASPVAARADDTATLAPIAVIDAQYQRDPHVQEGFDGFSFARIQLGARGELDGTVSAVGLVDFATPESPTVIDAYVDWHPNPAVDVQAGYVRSPLFISARDEFVERLPVPELSVLANALWPGREVGVAGRLRGGDGVPFELWARVANAANAVTGNDTNWPAADLRLDYVYGRERALAEYGHLRAGDRSDSLGVRVGLGGHVDTVDDRGGVGGFTATGYEFYRAPVVSGDRYIAEGHALVQLEDVQLLVEAGAARESRHGDVTADPTAPRPQLDSVDTLGASAEVSWMITGDHRIPGVWPRDPALHRNDYDGAIELAARAEHVDFGRCATGATECTTSVQRMIANVGGAAIHWWVRRETALSLAGYTYHWDQAPFDQPGVRSTYLVLARLTLSIR